MIEIKNDDAYKRLQTFGRHMLDGDLQVTHGVKPPDETVQRNFTGSSGENLMLT